MRELVGLLDRQAVEIGAQADRARRVADPQPSDHSGFPHSAMHLDAAKFGELCGNEIGGAAFLEPEFGMRVDVAPDAGQLVMEPGNGIENRHDCSPPLRPYPALSPSGGGGSACAVWELC